MKDHELLETIAAKNAAWAELGRLEKARTVWNRLGGNGPELETLADWRDETRERFEDARGRYLRLALRRR